MHRTLILLAAVGWVAYGEDSVPLHAPAHILNLEGDPSLVVSEVTAGGGEVLFVLPELAIVVVRDVPPERIAAWVASGLVVSAGEDLDLSGGDPAAQTDAEAIDPGVEPLYANQWGMRMIQADVAHRAGFTGAGARVAVIDTGIYYLHPDLDDRYVGGHNFFAPFCATYPTGRPSNCDPLDPIDDDGHGTLVAGTIAAEANGVGIIGVAPEAELLAVKVCGSNTNCPASAIIAGIHYAVLEGADVMNISIGGYVDLRDPAQRAVYEAMKRATNFAHSRGVLVVQSSGNEAANMDTEPEWLLRARGEQGKVLVVSAVGPDGLTATRSGVPYSTIGKSLVDLAAPGGSTPPTSGLVFSTCTPLSRRLPCPTLYRYPGFGTSFATAHASGAAAQIVAQIGRARGNQVFQRLIHHADDVGAAGKDAVYGWGRLNVWRALQSE